MIVMAIHMAIVMASRMALFEFRFNQYVCFPIWLEHSSPALAAEKFSSLNLCVVGCMALRIGVRCL